MSGYFECMCCGTVDMGDGPLCDVCDFVGCGEEGDSPACRVCIVDGSAGVYVGREFVTRYNMADWHVSVDDVTALLAGPESEDYWEAWDSITGYGAAYFVDSEGARWELEQDGDLFARAVAVPMRDDDEAK